MRISTGPEQQRTGRIHRRRGPLLLCLLLACMAAVPAPGAEPAARLRTVFVIVLENAAWHDIKGNPDAPFLNHALLPRASYTEAYRGPRRGRLHPSLPNYIWLEAGDHLKILDDGPPAAHHLATANHLVTLLERSGISWRTYQQGIRGDRCPLADHGDYRPKHNPMIYFDDVTDGNDPRAARCIRHVRPLRELTDDLARNTVARYNFIAPDLCHDMHSRCRPLDNRVKQGDEWLRRWIPRIMKSKAYRSGGAVFITWDEAWFSVPFCMRSDCPIGMIVLSPLAKGHGYRNKLAYDHSSTLKTVQEILGVSPLLRAAGAPQTRDLRDLFTSFP